MLLNSPPTPASNIAATLAANRLGVPAVVFFVISAAAPLTVVAGGATTGYAITGVPGIPVAYFATATILALFAVGYVAMSRRVVNAGAFYTYIANGLGRPAGVGGAMVALLAYNAMQIGLYGGFGAVTADFVNPRLGVDVAWWAYALAAWAAVAVLGVMRVDLNGRVLAVVLSAEIFIAVLFDVVMLAHPAPATGLSLATLSPAHLVAPGIGAALVTTLTGFVGFENTTVFAEETRDPKRTVARATYIAVAITGLLYGLSAWAMSVATGPDRIVAAATEDSTNLIFNLVQPHVGRFAVTVGQVLFISSLFAAVLSFHHTVARYTFALGREGVVPAWLGRTSRRSGAPAAGSLTQTVLALAVLVGYVVAEADPIKHLFFWVTVTGGLGVLILMASTSAAVVGFFIFQRRGETRWRWLVAPGLATGLLGLVLWATIDDFATLLGVEPSSPLRWIFPVAYAVAALIGIGWALLLRVLRPAVYEGIGLGARSVTARALAPLARSIPAGAEEMDRS
ncbi:APC family permease [Plantactinospora sp. KLBMP9567]|uniref:APC family permease n=1 Tax=Plantactinospora sp. KLBMP9567 TaxID=3085900 RepID=UPI0029818978|nr:APC family permease [Plantactinospora sp. KLBMP9567]MDW5325349.1 APC family permease [Plantactinospora sp. KLBMP9567]